MPWVHAWICTWAWVPQQLNYDGGHGEHNYQHRNDSWSGNDGNDRWSRWSETETNHQNQDAPVPGPMPIAPIVGPGEENRESAVPDESPARAKSAPPLSPKPKPGPKANPKGLSLPRGSSSSSTKPAQSNSVKRKASPTATQESKKVPKTKVKLSDADREWWKVSYYPSDASLGFTTPTPKVYGPSEPKA